MKIKHLHCSTISMEFIKTNKSFLHSKEMSIGSEFVQVQMTWWIWHVIWKLKFHLSFHSQSHFLDACIDMDYKVTLVVNIHHARPCYNVNGSNAYYFFMIGQPFGMTGSVLANDLLNITIIQSDPMNDVFCVDLRQCANKQRKLQTDNNKTAKQWKKSVKF